MILSVARRYVFEARHSLTGAPSPWCHVHPHHYTVEVVVTGGPDEAGMVVDTDTLDNRWARIAYKFAGCNLDDTLPVVTTVESIAAWLVQELGASEVTVWEDKARWGRAIR